MMKQIIVFAFFALFVLGCTHSDTHTVKSPYLQYTVTKESGFGSSNNNETIDTEKGIEDCVSSNLNVIPGGGARAFCLAQATALAQGRGTTMQPSYGGLGLVPMMPNTGGPVTILGAQTMSPQQSAFSNTNGTVGLIETSSPAGARSGSGDQEVIVETTKALADHSRRIKKIENRLAGGKK